MRVKIQCGDSVHFARVFRDGMLDARADAASTWEIFELEDFPDGRFALRTVSSHPRPNMYIRAHAGGGGNLSADRTAPLDHEKYTKESLPGGRVAIRTHSGNYWRAKQQGGAELDCRADVPSTWEVFEIQPV